MKNKKHSLTYFLFFGLILKIAVSLFTYHPDTKALQMAATIISQNHLWLTLYDYIPQLPPNHPLLSQYGPEVMNYPPMAYWFQAIWHKLTSFLISPQTNTQFIFTSNLPLNTYNFNWLLLIFKLKYIFFDAGIAYLIFKLTKQNQTLSLIWWLNPFTLYATYMMGQFDIIPLFFAFLAHYTITKHKNLYLASFWLGMGGAFKIFPLLFLPFITTYAKSLKQQLTTFIIGLTTYFLPSLPFIHSYGYKTYALIASQTDKIFNTKIMLTGSQYLSLFLLSYTLLFTLHYLKPKNLNFTFFSIMALFFAFVHFHPQWIIFIVPWIILFYHSKPNPKITNILTILSCLYLLIVLSFDTSLNINLFTPLWGSPVTTSTQPPLFFINQFYPFHDFVSLIRTIWAGILLALILIFNSLNAKQT